MLNVVHGTKDVVNYILDHPDIKAVSFVGSNTAGRYIYARGAANGKRVQVRMKCKYGMQCHIIPYHIILCGLAPPGSLRIFSCTT